MSDLLAIGASAVNAYQRALATVGNNIANLSTEGYSRQEAALSAGAPAQSGQLYLGTGVNVTGVKRAYDAFAQSNLRDTSSALAAQQPLLDFANRVVDVLGNQQSGLGGALSDFFGSAQALATSPASTDARSSFLASADSLAARFRGMAGQFDMLDQQSAAAVDNDVGTLNSLATQLAAINAQLAKVSGEDRQPPDLLDQRDRLLGAMAKLTTISVATDANGSVKVGLGSGAAQAPLVEGDRSVILKAKFDAADRGKVDLVVDPYGKPSTIAPPNGGEIAGYLAFRQQVLQPSAAALDSLALTFGTAVNEVQTGGVTMKGLQGPALYRFQPIFKVDAPATRSQVNVTAVVVDPGAFAYHPLQLRYDAATAQWSARDLVSGATTEGPSPLLLGGLRLDVSGAAADGDTLVLTPQSRPAAGIQLGLTDPRDIAAASLFRASADPGNATSAAISVSPSEAGSVLGGPRRLETLANNPASNPATDLPITANQPGQLQPVVTVAAGTGSPALFLQQGAVPGVDLMAFTRDGRQVLGPPLALAEQQEMLSPANGFQAGATYSGQYCNVSGSAGYLGLSVFYGARASSAATPTLDPRSNTLTRHAELAGSPMPGSGAGIAAGALVLNGVPLPAIDASTLASAGDFAAWLNQQIPSLGIGGGIQASAMTRIRIAGDDLRLKEAGAGLSLQAGGGTWTIAPPGTNVRFESAQDIADQINASGASTRITAQVAPDGSLVISNSPGHEGEAIDLGTPPGASNVLGLPLAAGQWQHHAGQLLLAGDGEIRLAVGPGGSAGDLAKLGLRTEASISGTVPEDLLVFAAAGTAGAVATLSTSYQKGSIDPVADQRSRPLRLTFSSADTYRITDQRSGTILAERAFTAGQAIRYGSLSITLQGEPTADDSFLIDGNTDGTGDNRNANRLCALQSDTSLFPSGRTLAQSYADTVTGAGQVSSQASATQQALKVMEQQAQQTRDSLAGVNLDNEATDLVRFQQAYQAAAKSVQIGTQLFDAVLNIR